MLIFGHAEQNPRRVVYPRIVASVYNSVCGLLLFRLSLFISKPPFLMNLLPILVVTWHILGEGTYWWCTNATCLTGTIAHHLGVDCAGHAVMELRVEFGQHIGVPDAGLADIAHSSRLNNVADNKLLDRLILGHTTGTVGAAHGLHMAAIVLVTSTITALLRHLGSCIVFNWQSLAIVAYINSWMASIFTLFNN